MPSHAKNNLRIARLIVATGERNSSPYLSESLRTFLIGRLIRYIDRPSFPRAVFLDGLCESLKKTKSERLILLKYIGDTNLIFVGLFPRQEDIVQKDADYFQEVGKSAYIALASEFGSDQVEKREFYLQVAKEFDSLVSILKCSRGVESVAEIKYREWWCRDRIKGFGPRNGFNRPKRG